MRISRIVTLLAAVGIVVARNACAQAPARPTEPPRLRGTIDLTIGDTNDSRDDYVFGVIDGLATDAQGRIIVADRKDNTIRVFAANGKHLYSFGQKGKGPGDLDTPCCLTTAKDGLLWVKENANHRYSAFRLGETKATFVRSVRGTTNSVWSTDRVDFDAKGRIIDLESAFNASTKAFRVVRAHIDSAGTAMEHDTIPKPPADSLSGISFPTKSGFASYNQPFGATELHAYGAGGEMAHAVSSNYAVSWVGTDGRRKALLQRSAVPAPALSIKERESTEELLNSISRNTGVPRANLKLTVPSRKMPLNALGFDLDGRLWVERSAADGQPGEADVYGRNGQWSAIMQWPTGVSMRFWTVRGRSGLAVAENDDGVQRVVRIQFK